MTDEGPNRETYYLDEEVIGSASKYHRPVCHVLSNIYKVNHKRLRNWQEAVAIGLKPCGICNPFYYPPEPESPKSRIGF